MTTTRSKRAAGTYKPMLATLDTSIPHGDDWAHEVKFDGFRAIAYVAAASASSSRGTTTT